MSALGHAKRTISSPRSRKSHTIIGSDPMPQAPLISIVTPTRNRRDLLRETMESVARQTLAGWEHIIVDDGSNDGTAETVRERAARDTRVRYLPRSGAASGANVCRNQGLAVARADLVVFLDSDDVLEPDCLGRRVEIMQRNRDLDFVVSRMGAFVAAPRDLAYRQEPNLVGDDLLAFLFFEVPWQTTAPTWRRAALERLGGFDESLPSWQDVDLHVRAICAGLRYLRLPQTDYHMRWQEDPDKISLLQRRSPDHLVAANAMLTKFERIVREGPGMTWTRQRALCSLYFFVAERWVALGNLTEALRTWRKARARELAPAWLHLSGAALLLMHSKALPLRHLVERVTHKWKGWARLRANPELVQT
jgi:glycosyltransferase involved in cell wall biosynthesis